MKEEALFDVKLVRSFIASLRKKGELSLPSSLSSKNVKEMSTPFLAWIVSNRSNLHELNVEEVWQRDQKRKEYVVGCSIFGDSRNNFYPSFEQKYENSISIISEHWKELSELIRILSPRVSLPANNQIKYESSSDPKTFGEIIFNMEHPSTMRWVEVITHEVGHLYLNALIGTRPMNQQMKEKLSEKRYSYIRDEERPLIGIVHGVFVQSLMMIMATKVIRNSDDQEYVKGAWATIERFQHKFVEDTKTIRTEELLNIHPEFEKFLNYGEVSLASLEEAYCEA